MASKAAQSASEYAIPTPMDYVATAEDGGEPPHAESLTAVAAEALRSGVTDPVERSAEAPVPGEERLQAGDPDVDPLENELSGDEIPGGDMTTPDQNNVDDIGRAAGVTDLDTGALTSGEELFRRRDERRWELDPRSKDPEG